jgi:hypothetical protein
MKAVITTLVVLVFTAMALADYILPNDPKTPLFVIYENHFDPPNKDKKPHTLQGHVGKLLLTVYALNDLLLEADKKGVRVVLTQKDAKVFAEITHKYQYPVLVTGDESAGTVMHFTAPIEDGSILFTDSNYSADIAKYLRLRYSVK